MELWEVVGGSDKGGILVRAGQDLKSEQLEDRLSCGARVKKLALVGERLHYERLTGSGPAQGWVSIKLKDKVLLSRLSPTIFDFEAVLPDDSTVSLSKYRSPATLIVNTASKCGFTKQYEGLQQLYSELSGRGLEILAFPCNQFGKQEPGTNETIQKFTKSQFGVDFPVFAKTDINGPSASSLFEFLKASVDGVVHKPPWARAKTPQGLEKDIQWNFTKFLCVNGKPVKRYSFDVDPGAIRQDIVEALNSPDSSLEALPSSQQYSKDTPPPLLVCFYSGGYTSAQGRNNLQRFREEAHRRGFEDSLILDNYPELPFDSCTSWEAYIQKLVKKIDENPDNQDRKLVLFGHSLGCHMARGLARILGKRVLKLYVVACRPCHISTYESFGLSTAKEFAALSDTEILEASTKAWPNEFLVSFRGREPLPSVVTKVTSLMRRQYGAEILGGVLGDASLTPAVEELRIASPIFAICCDQETPQGETMDKIRCWSELTTGEFQLETVNADHFGCLVPDNSGKCQLYELIFKDLQELRPRV